MFPPPRPLLVPAAGLLALALTAAWLAAQEPGKAEMVRAEELVRDVFKEEYARARTDRAAGKALAATLLRQAGQIQDEDAAVRLVALREARDLAARAGDTATAFRAVAELARDRAVNALAMKAAVVAEAAANLPAGADPAARAEAAALADTALALANSAAEAEDFDRAVRLADLAAQTAGKGQAAILLDAARRRGERLRLLQQETARVRPFVEKLRASPQDAKANTEVGRYWALVRGNWPRGLSLLARGGDESLRDQAARDLAQPQGAAGKLEVADGWWKLARRERGPARAQVLARALHWYQQALRQTTGAQRTRVEQRLAELRKAVPPELRGTDIAVEVGRLEGHRAEVLAAALTADGRHALSGGADRTVRLWDTATDQELRQFGGPGATVYGVAFSPDGKLAASCGEDRTIRLWDVAAGKERGRLEGHTDAVNNVAFSPDGRRLASASNDGTVRLWDVGTGKEVRKLAGHTQGAYSVAFSPDGKLLATGGGDRTVLLWELGGEGKPRRLEGHTGQVLSLSFAPDGLLLLSSGEDQTVRLWDVAEGKELRRYEGHTAAVGGVVFAPDGQRFLSCSDDRTLRLWEVDSGKELRQLRGHAGAVYRVALSADGRLALTCSLDRTLRLWGPPR